jgi:hypothetical protein
MNHLINRLQIEITCPDEEQAFRVRHDFSNYYQQQLVEIVDRVCSKYVPDDEWIRIDKLEIDMGYLSQASFDTRFPEIFIYRFEKELLQKLGQFNPRQREISRELSHAELLQFFLLTGTLPWWAEESDMDIGKISLEYLVSQPSSLRRFLEENGQNVTMWQRIARQLPRKAGSQIILLFNVLVSVIDQYKSWMDVIARNADSGTIPDLGMLNENIITVVLENAPVFFIKWPVGHELRAILNEKHFNLFPADLPGLELPISAPVEKNGTSFFQTESGIPEWNEFFKPREEFMTDKYYVRHAGIVLLAPFIQSFFKELGLLKGLLWKNEECRYRAIHLLNFLSTGMDNQPEYSLVLEKIICSTPVVEPIPLGIKLKENERAEALLLLESVIEHWKAIKNTTVEGLRETFLKRDGIITRHEQGWLVQIERKSWDVLLDKMPWGFSTLNLPWNDYLIYTEW